MRQYYLGALQLLLLCLGSCARDGRDVGQGLHLSSVGSLEVGEITVGNSGVNIEDHRDAAVHRKIRQDEGISVDELAEEASQISASNEPTGEMDNLPFEPIDIDSYWQSIYGTEDVPEFENPPEIEGKSLRLDDIIESEDGDIESIFNKRSLNEASDINSLHNSKQGEERESVENSAKEVDDDGNEPRRFVSTLRNVGTSSEGDFNSSRTSQGSEAEDVEDSIVIPSGDDDLKISSRETREPDKRPLENIDDIQSVATSNDGVSNHTKEDIVKSTNLKKYQFSFVENGVPLELYLDAEASSPHEITPRTCHGSLCCPKCGGDRSQATGVQVVNLCSCTEKIGNIGYNTEYLYPTYDGSGIYSLVNPGVGNIITVINGQPYVYEEQLGNRAITDAAGNGAVAGDLVIEKAPIIDVSPLERVGQARIGINTGRVHALKDADSVSIAQNTGFYGSGHAVGDSLPCSTDGLTASPSGRVGQAHIDINTGRVHALNDDDSLSIAQNTGLYGSGHVFGDSSASILRQDFVHSIGPNGELIIRRQDDSLGNVVHSHKEVVGYGESSGIGKGTSKSDVFADVKKQALDTKKQVVQSTIIKLGDIGQMILNDGKKLVRNIAGKLEEILNAKEARERSRGKAVDDILIDQKHGFINDENTFESATHSSSHIHSDHEEHVDSSALSDSAIIVDTESSHTDADVINSFSHNEAGIISANHGAEIVGNAIIKAESAVATHNTASAIDTSSQLISANEEHAHSAVQSASHIAVNEELSSTYHEASSSGRHEDAVIINTNQDVVGHSGSHLSSGFISAGEHASASVIDTSSQLISANEEHAHSAVQSASHIAVNEELASTHHEASSSARHEDAVIINTNQDVVGHSGSHLSSGFISAGDCASASAIDTSSQLISANEEHAHSAVQSASHITVNEELSSTHHEASSSGRHEDAVIINTNQDVVGHSGSHLSSGIISAGEHASASVIDTSSQLISANEEHAHSAVQSASHIAVNEELASTHHEASSSARHEDAVIINTNQDVVGYTGSHLSSGFISAGKHASASAIDTSSQFISDNEEHAHSAVHSASHIAVNEELASTHEEAISSSRHGEAAVINTNHGVIGHSSGHLNSGFINVGESAIIGRNDGHDYQSEVINHAGGHVTSGLINTGECSAASATDTSRHFIGAGKKNFNSAIHNVGHVLLHEALASTHADIIDPIREIGAETVHCKRHISHADTDIYPVVIDAIKYNPVMGSATLHSSSYGAVGGELTGIHNEAINSLRHGEAIILNTNQGDDCEEEIINHTGGHINSGFINAEEHTAASAIDTSGHIVSVNKGHAHSALHSASHVAVNEELGSTHQDSFGSVRHGEGAIINSDLVAGCEEEIISHTGGHINSGFINAEEHTAASAIDTSGHIVSVNEGHAHSALHSASHVAVNEELGSTHQDSFGSVRHGEEIISHTGGHINSGFINAEEHTAATAIGTSGHIISVNDEHAHSALHSASHVAVNEELESTHQDSFSSVRHGEGAIINSDLVAGCEEEIISHTGGHINSGFINAEEHTAASAIDTSGHIVSVNEGHAHSALHSGSRVAVNEELGSIHQDSFGSVRHGGEIISHTGGHINSGFINAEEHTAASAIDTSGHIVSVNEEHAHSALHSASHVAVNEELESTHQDSFSSVRHGEGAIINSNLVAGCEEEIISHTGGHINSGFINAEEHTAASAIDTSGHIVSLNEGHAHSALHSASHVAVNEELESTHQDSFGSVRHGEEIISHTGGHINSGFINAEEHATTSAIDTSGHIISVNDKHAHSDLHSASHVAVNEELESTHQDSFGSVRHGEEIISHTGGHINFGFINAEEHTAASAIDTSGHIVSVNEEHAHSALHSASHVAVNEELESTHQDSFGSVRHEEAATILNSNLGNDCAVETIVHAGGQVNSEFISAEGHTTAAAVDTSGHIISANEEHAHSALHSASHVALNEELESTYNKDISSIRHEEAAIINRSEEHGHHSEIIGHAGAHVNSEDISTGEYITASNIDSSSHIISSNEEHVGSALSSISHSTLNKGHASTHKDTLHSVAHAAVDSLRSTLHNVAQAIVDAHSGVINTGNHNSATAIDTSTHTANVENEHINSVIHSASRIGVNEELASTHNDALSSIRHEEAAIFNKNQEVIVNEELASTHEEAISSSGHGEAEVINTNHGVIGHSSGHLNSEFTGAGEYNTISGIDTSSHLISSNEERIHSGIHSIGQVASHNELSSGHKDALCSVAHAAAKLIHSHLHDIGHAIVNAHSKVAGVGEHSSSHLISANEEHTHSAIHGASHIAVNEELASSHGEAISSTRHEEDAIFNTNQEIVDHSGNNLSSGFISVGEHGSASAIDTSSQLISANVEHAHSAVQSASHVAVNEELSSTHHEASSSARHEDAVIINTNQDVVGHSGSHLSSGFISAGEHASASVIDTSSQLISANEEHAHSAVQSASHVAVNEELLSTHHEASSSARHEDAVIINRNQDVVGHSGSHLSSGFISAGDCASDSAIDTSSQLISANEEHAHSAVQSVSHVAVNEELLSTHHEASSSARHEDAVIINTNQDVVGHSGSHLSSGFINAGEHGSVSAIDTSSQLISANEEHALSAVQSASHVAVNEELSSTHHEASSSARHEDAVIINTNQDVVGHSGSHLSSGFISAGEHASASVIDTSSQLISANEENAHSAVQSASHTAVNEELSSTHHEASSSARHEDAVIINRNQDVVGHSGSHLSSGFISAGDCASDSAIDTSSQLISANEEHAHSAVQSASHVAVNEELLSTHHEASSSARHEDAVIINTNQDVVGHSGSHQSSGFINAGEHGSVSAIDTSSHIINANEEHAYSAVQSASHIAANEESLSSHIGAISTVSHNDAAIISTNQEDDCKTGIIGHSVGHVNTELLNVREHDDSSVFDTSSHTINAEEEHFDSAVQDISAEGHIITNTDSGMTRVAGHSTASAIDAFSFGHNEHVHSRIGSSELGNIEGPCKYSVNAGEIQGSVKNEFLESAVDQSTRLIENVINEAAKEFQMSADPSVKEKIVNLAASTVRKVITGVAEETARKFELAEQTAASTAALNHINLNAETVGVLLPADHHPHIYNTGVLDFNRNTDCARDVAIELYDNAGNCDNSGLNPESFYNVDHYDLMYDNPKTFHDVPVDFDIQFESGSSRHLANNWYFDNNIHHFQRSRGHTFVPVAKINNELYRENLYNYNQFVNAANNGSEKYELSPQTNFQLKFPHGGPVPFEFIKKHLSRGHDLAMEMRERVKWLESGSLHPKPHTASKLHFLNNKVSDSTMKINEESELALFATKLLQHGLSLEYNITPNTFLEFLRHHGLRITNKDVCAARYKRCKGDFEKYRSFDGSCNNAEHPTWGQSNLGFLRIIPPRYSDGIHAMPVSVTGEELPGPRLLSTTFFRRYNVTHSDFTLALAQWGQILSHDLAYQIMDQTVQGGIECCTSNGQSQLPKSLQHHSCMPIDISARDRFYKKYNQRCMNFVRSMTISKDDCTLGSADQLNGVTSYLDCSTIYGSDKSSCDQLRLFEGGRLKVELRRGRIMMPTTHDKSGFCDIVSPSEVCYQSGDVRANQNPHLVILLTLLVREHNRIAKELCTLNPHWGDERVFQEARRIVIAQYQHITYDEWLPLVIGRRYCKRFKLTRSRSGLSDDYNPKVNPTTINSFTSSAFRYFHSMVDGNINLCPASRHISHTLRLSNHYFRPQILERNNNFDELLRGLVTQRMQNADTNFHPELTEYLFRSRNDYGLDLAAIDIQRGRDNGIPGYNAYRKICRLKHAQDFGDLHEEISWDRIEELRHTYAHVDDIDLLVGAAMERRSSGSFLGPTMRCLIGEQFYRSRVGDRYFYDHGNVPRSFTEEQFQEIKKASLARLICDNEETVTMIQRNPFKVISYRNPLVSCRSLPKPNLAPWKE